MIKGDFLRKGDMIKGVIKKVEMKNNNPIVIMSRTDSKFLEKLMEQEVPEIEDGLITVKKIVRIPGERAKVAVESYDDRIDPVGACVGMKGSRIHGIVRELKNENIDIVNFTNNNSLFIQRALTPAKISNIELDLDKGTASVFLKPDQVSLAIGKGGSNIKLASRLTGFEIDVYREDDDPGMEDVDLDEFALSGNPSDNGKQTNLNDTLVIVQNNLRLRIKETKTKLIVNELPTVKGSFSNMVQLYQNLISNAIKFKKTDTKPCIRVGYREREHEYVLFVQDNGIGIAEEHRKHIFQVFTRLDIHKEGTGIGLATCKKIVKNLNGKIWVESQVGQGSTFYITLPK